jgi:hypothetical protein
MTYQVLQQVSDQAASLNSEYVPKDDFSEWEQHAKLAGLGEPIYGEEDSDGLAGLDELR